MSALAVFEHKQFGNVQVIEFEGAIYFNPDMVAKALGYKDADSMLRVFETIPQEDMALYVRHFTYQELSELHLKGGVKQNQRINWSPNGKRFLTEPGLFFLLNRSEKPLAYPFQKWVNTQVLPQIRKDGSYQLPPQSRDKSVIEMKSQLLTLTKQQQEIKKQQEETNMQVFAIKREMQVQAHTIKQEIKDQFHAIKKELLSLKTSVSEGTADFPDEALMRSKFIKSMMTSFWKLHEEQHITREELEKLIALFENHLEKQQVQPLQKKSGYSTQEKADLKRAALILQDDFKRSPLEIAAKFNEDGVETLSGKGEWTAAKVKRLLAS